MNSPQRQGLTKEQKRERKREAKEAHKLQRQAKRMRDTFENNGALISLRDDRSEVVKYPGMGRLAEYLNHLFQSMPLDTLSFQITLDFARHRTHLARCLADMSCIPGDEIDARVTLLLEGLPHARERLFSYVWQLYNVAHRRAAPRGSSESEGAAGHMWQLLMYMFLDQQRRLNDADAFLIKSNLQSPARAFNFTLLAERYSEPMIVSQYPVGYYSVATHWKALSSLVVPLYDFAYSNIMYNYFKTLCVRHAELLQPPPQNMDAVEIERLYDHPKYCTGAHGVPILINPLADAESLARLEEANNKENDLDDDDTAERMSNLPVLCNSEYLSDVQPLLGNQMRRFSRIRMLLDRASTTGIIVDTRTTDSHDLGHTMNFIKQLAKHDLLRRFVVEGVKKDLLRTQLFHGEAQRFIRKQPRQHPEPDNILATMRHHTYREMPSLLDKSIETYCTEFEESLLAIDARSPMHTTWEERVRPVHEGVIAKCLFVATDVWLISHNAAKEYLSSRWHFEELHIGRDEYADVFQLPAKRPSWVRCMRWNFVIDKDDKMVYAGLSMIRAYVAWLRATFGTADAAAMREVTNEKGGHLFRRCLHKEWRHWFPSFNSNGGYTISEGRALQTDPSLFTIL